MKTILFQGDSITDAGRARENTTQLGFGYPRLVEAQLGFDHPNEYEFQNRGISGDRVPNIYARIVHDILNLKPDYMSVLIGVNDVWRSIDANCGTGEARFEKVYDILLSEVREELPDIKLMLLEPFVLPGPATINIETIPDRWERFDTGVRNMAKIVERLAEKHGAYFVPLQDKFDAAAKSAPPEYWLYDGVHPSAKGHELIKREWIKAFELIK